MTMTPDDAPSVTLPVLSYEDGLRTGQTEVLAFALAEIRAAKATVDKAGADAMTKYMACLASHGPSAARTREAQADGLRLTIVKVRLIAAEDALRAKFE